MKRAGWKEEDRALSVRAEIAQAGRVAWHSPSRGTFSEGRNKAKARRRARQFGRPWVNPRAMVARPTKPVAPAANKRRRAMTAKRRELAKRLPDLRRQDEREADHTIRASVE